MRVLVTRPEPGASSTAGRLRALGYETVLMPMTRIVDMAADMNGVANAAAFAVTSASAVRSWQSRGIGSDLFQRPLYAVGARTAAVARDSGFKSVTVGDGDGSHLARLVEDDVRSGRLRLTDEAPLAYLCGKVRHGGFEVRLRELDVPLKTVEIYDIEEISYPTDFILNALSAGEKSAVLLYSRVAADCFFQLCNSQTIVNQLKDISFFCMSENVLEAVPENLRSHARISPAPDEESLLSLLPGSDKLF